APAQDAYVKAIGSLIEHQAKAVDQGGEDAREGVRSAVTVILTLGAAALALAGLIAWLVTRSITRPLREAVAVAGAVAGGDLTSRVEVRSKDETGQLLQALKDMNENLKKIVGDVRTSSEAIGTGSGEIATGNADLSNRTEEQAS